MNNMEINLVIVKDQKGNIYDVDHIEYISENETIVHIRNVDEKLKNVNLIEELSSTFVDVALQLKEDEKRYGNTWKERGLVFNGQSQEERFFHKMMDYITDYRENGTSINWLKVIGEAHIAYVRENKLK